MNTSHKIHLVEIPLGGNGGILWNRLHDEREDICEAMLKESRTADYEAASHRDLNTTSWHRELLQARIRTIDDALDRLMSGSHGNCSKCGRGIDDTKLEFDPAIALCPNCLERDQNHPETSTRDLTQTSGSTRGGVFSQIELTLDTLQPFDTILVRTLNSDYRIFLLDPKTGRALIDGGQYLSEPREGVVSGSSSDGSFKAGSIAMGQHLVMWVDGKILNTSRVQSMNVKHCDATESIETITAALH